MGAVQALGDPDAAQGEGGVDDAVHAPVEELGDRRVLLGRVAAGVDGQDEVLAVPGGLHGAAQQPAAKGEEAISSVTRPITAVRRRRRPRATGSGR